MIALNVVLSLLAASAAAASYPKLAGDPLQLTECASHATDADKVMAQHLTDLDLPFNAQEEINIDTYMHVVAESKDEAGGHVSVNTPIISNISPPTH